MLPCFTCARAIGNLSSMCLGVDILRLEMSKSEKSVPSVLKNIFALLFFLWIWGFYLLLKFLVSTNKLLWSLSVSFQVILPL